MLLLVPPSVSEPKYLLSTSYPTCTSSLLGLQHTNCLLKKLPQSGTGRGSPTCGIFMLCSATVGVTSKNMPVKFPLISITSKPYIGALLVKCGITTQCNMLTLFV